MLYGQKPTVTDLMKIKIEKRDTTHMVTAKGVVLFSQTELPKFYANRDFQLAWVDDKNRNDLLSSILSAYREGLDPKDYHLDRILNILAKSSYNDLIHSDMVDLDLLMTDALILYAAHLISGKVEQSELNSIWDIELNQRPKNIDSLLTVTLKEQKILAAIEEVKPQHYFYKLLKFNLKKYREIAKKGGWPKIDEGPSIEKGDYDTRIQNIKKYLSITGDYKGELVLNDSLFDDGLEAAVKKFQHQHHLIEDGIIGKGTLQQMNVSVEERINTIRINLERTRWVLHHPEKDFLMVNIAGFYIKRFQNDLEVFHSKVIVGKYHLRSPIFKGVMRYVTINPHWTLPYSIASHESLPMIQKDSLYLTRNHMIVMDKSGKVLDPKAIDFSEYAIDNFPFILRQEAGPWNDLGLIKFMFPNKYSVYLHDTPAKSLFDLPDRAFSHGCIRIEKKWELLMNLMDDEEQWHMDRINELISAGETKTFNLPKPINIYIMYWTARVDENSNLFFMKDIYKRDPAVLKALNTPVVFEKYPGTEQ